MNTKFLSKAFIALLLISTSVSIVANSPVASAHEVGETNAITSGQVLDSRSASLQVSRANTDLQKALTAYTKASRNFKSAALANLVLIAKDRKAKMVQEAMDNPSGFLSSTLPSNTMNQIPTEVRSQIEQQTTLSGKVIVLHVDSEDASQSHYNYYLEDSISHRKYQLDIANGNLIKEANSIISATGTLLDNNLVMSNVDTSSSSSDVKVVKSVGILNSLGDQHTLAMRIKFSNVANTSISYNDVENNIFTGTHSVNAYFKDSSSNLISFSGDITPPLSIPFDNTNCLTRSFDWAEAADAAAIAAGYNLAEYARKIYYADQATGCGGEGGLGELGTNPSRTWVYKSPIYDYPTYNFGVAIHEIGHNLGMNHANTLSCGASAIDIYSNCTVREYGDLYDVMGSDITNFKTLNGAHRSMEGWLPNSQTQVVATSGTFTVAPIETPSSATRVLKILKPNDTSSQGDVYYYVEYRQPIGVDSGLPSAIVQGVSVILSQSPIYPGTGRVDLTPGDFNFSNSALTDNGTFTDQINHITIKQLSHNSNGATVQVTLGNTFCVRAAPTITVSPTSQSIPTPSNNTSIYYVESITNNDPTGCPPSTFVAGAQNMPSGILPGGSSKLLNPGEKGDLQMVLTFSGYIGSGQVNLLANVDDQNNIEGHYATTPVSFTTPGGNCVKNAPSMTILASSLTGTAGQPLAYNVSVTNNDPTTCPAVPNNTTFTALGLPTGFTYSSTPLALLPGATGNATVTVRSSSNAIDGTNNFSIKAANSSGSATKSVAYVVKNLAICTSVPPSVNISPLTQTVSAGQSANYTVSVTNADTASCSSSTFAINATGLPAGFTSNSSSVTLAAGGTSFTTLTVTSPSNATNSINNFNVNVSDSLNPTGHNGSVAANYIVNNPCNRLAPIVSVSPSQQTGAPGESKSYQVLVSNKDASNCGSSTFRIGATGLPSGFTSTTVDVNVAPGSFGSGTLIVTSPSNANSSTTFNIIANDVAISNHSGTTTATYFVEAPVACSYRAAPSVNIYPQWKYGAAGSTIAYTATVYNYDSADCPSTTFTLSPNFTYMPAGFTYTTDTPTFTLAAGGSSKQVTLNVTSPTNAQAGSNYFIVNIDDNSVPNHSTGESTYYVVTNVLGDSTTVPYYSPDMIARVKELAMYFFPNAIFPK